MNSAGISEREIYDDRYLQDDYQQFSDEDILAAILGLLIFIATILCACIIYYACCAALSPSQRNQDAHEDDPPSEYYDDENGGVTYADIYDTSQRSGLAIATEIEDD